MKNTHIAVVLDRSGSMASCKSDVIGGFNQFLNDQKKQEGEATITLTQFDTEYDVLANGISIKHLAELTNETYQPRGMTALYDAIGRTIEATKIAVLSAICSECGACKADDETNVIFVIITDGHENASVEFSHDQVMNTIKACRENLGWEFVFIGAAEDSMDVGASLGINLGTCATYSATSEGTKALYSVVSCSVSNYRSSGKLDDFNDEDREQMNKK